MIGWLHRVRARKQLIESEADELMRRFDDRAYSTARDLMRMAREKSDPHAERLYAKVAVVIASRTGKEIGLDTATRYLS